MKKNIRRPVLLALCLALALSFAGCRASGGPRNVPGRSTPAPDAATAFDQLVRQELVDSMESDYLTLHSFFEHPENYGIDPANARMELGRALTEDDLYYNDRLVQRAQRQLAKIDREQLSPLQQDTYELYAFMLEGSAALGQKEYQYLSPAFSPLSGLYAQLPSLFTDYLLRTEQDIEPLILLLEDTGATFESYLDYTREQRSQGLLLLDPNQVASYCRQVAGEGENSPVLASLCAAVDALGLPKDRAAEYKQRVTDAFTNSFLPAYNALANAMGEFSPAVDGGLATLPGGQEYYELLFQQSVGTTRPVREVFNDLGAMAYEALAQCQHLLRRNPELADAFDRREFVTGYTDFDAMVADLEGFTGQHFPSVPPQNYVIDPIAPSIAADGVDAYFCRPAVDGTAPLQIRVNLNESAGELATPELFTTVAHESFPGHLYQEAYAAQQIADPFRTILCSFSGYSEGYATYAELYAYNYILSEPAARLYQCYTLLGNCLVAQLDIGIHYFGWSRAEAEEFLGEYGMYSDELYTQIVTSPCVFSIYYVGCMEFVHLRQKAEYALEEAFDEIEFHQVVLENGTITLDMLRNKVDAYLADKQSAEPQPPAPPAESEHAIPWKSGGAHSTIALALAG